MSSFIKLLLLIGLVIVVLIGGTMGYYLVVDPASINLQNNIAVPYDTDDLQQACTHAREDGRRGSPQCYENHDDIYRTDAFTPLDFIYGQGEGR